MTTFVPRFTDYQKQAILSGKVRCFVSPVGLGNHDASFTMDGHTYTVTGYRKMELTDLMTAHWQELGYSSRMEGFDHWERTHLEKVWYGIETVYLYRFEEKI